MILYHSACESFAYLLINKNQKQYNKKYYNKKFNLYYSYESTQKSREL